MPTYVYELVEGTCKLCKGRFELNRPISRPELTQCPVCRKPVRKVIAGFNTPKLMKPLSVTDAKSAGFSVWKKRDTGVYERE